ncbi:hypothetical protein [Sinorhizobium meliloti]|uniref:Uncharacterized protein n=1 Tax=Rhizobium meliloti TaxID=382 RepID=A0A2J0YTU9_RHIML|nr:hypothetical protein [Sinorhizobium meliloti]PJR09720.1 hypothetical protein CEJ86_30880 [Sinorhizobium meliloti]
MLPMTPGYADYLIDAFLVHHVIDLAVRADEQAEPSSIELNDIHLPPGNRSFIFPAQAPA